MIIYKPYKIKTTKYLPFIPPAHGISELRFDVSSKSGHFINGFIKAQVEYYAAQNHAYLEFGTETPTPGYALFNAGVGGTFTNKNKKHKRRTILFLLSFVHGMKMKILPAIFPVYWYKRIPALMK